MQEPNVSIGVMFQKEIQFELDGEFTINSLDTVFSGAFTATYIDENTYRIRQNDDVYTIEDEVVFMPKNEDTHSFVLKDVTIGIKFHWERKEDQRFKGALKFVPEDEKLTAINILPVEDYLVSVISSEMSATSSAELLKAHSIISRGWLLAQIKKRKIAEASERPTQSVIRTEKELIKWYDSEDHTKFDVCADDHCQRYQGITRASTEAVRNAVEKTKGMVLTYNNQICDARFSKSCGGVVETFENVWEPVSYPYLAKVIDNDKKPADYDLDLKKEEAAEHWIRTSPPAFCNTTDKKILSQVLNDYDQETMDFYRWKVEYTQEKIADLINTKTGIDFGQIVDLIPVERGESGRLVRLKIFGTKNVLTIGKELEIRRTLSDSHLYSSAFVVDRHDLRGLIPQKFVLTGAGWGHGVGLCQIGAAVMGARGYNYKQILLHYFVGANIEKYW